MTTVSGCEKSFFALPLPVYLSTQAAIVSTMLKLLTGDCPELGGKYLSGTGIGWA